MSTKEFETLDDLIAYQAAREGRLPRSGERAPSEIQYLIGDATVPGYPTRERIICHVCNDVGAWGAGFTRSVSRLSPAPERSYRDAIRQTQPKPLGAASLAKVNPSLFVANMIAQRGLPTKARRVVIDYPALEECLGFVGKIAADWEASCHMPRIGCGLAGGDWRTIEAIIVRTLCALGVPTYVYDLPRSDREN